MARKTFISYKYSDSINERNEILEALGEDAKYYRGETSESPDISNHKTDTIKCKLSDMIYDTSVIIVIISENIDKSKWIEWEVNYATSVQSRRGRQSPPNGVVLVVPDRLINANNKYNSTKVNRLLKKKGIEGVVTVRLSSFLINPGQYIEEAYDNR